MSRNGLGAMLSVICFCMPIQAFTQTQSTAPIAGTVTISGRVVLKGEPVIGATVTLFPRQGSYRAGIPRAQTDGEGRFQLTGVSAGRSLITALIPGYVVLGEYESGTSGRAITILEGEKVENFDLEITRGGIITGRVTDAKGKPVVDERVRPVMLNKNGRAQIYSDSFSAVQFVTDDRGMYRIFGLPEGRYLVSVGQGQIAGVAIYNASRIYYPLRFHPDATDQSKAKPVEVLPGSEVEGVDIAMGNAQRAYNITGRVILAETGQPAAGVRVAYEYVDKDQTGMNLGHSTQDRTNRLGNFRVFGVLSGKYRLFAQFEKESDLYSETTLCEIVDEDLKGVEVRIRPGASISGVVEIEGTFSASVRENLKDIQIYAGSSLQLAKYSIVKPDGSFSLRGLQPGTVDLGMSFRNVPPNGLSKLRVEHQGILVRDGIEVRAGEHVKGVRFIIGFAPGVLKGQIK